MMDDKLIIIKKENIINAKEKFIIHQVNCKGKMNSGVAYHIRKKFPYVFYNYSEICKKFNNNQIKLLGRFLSVKINCENRFIINLFSQLSYGKNKNMIYTNYTAFEYSIINFINNFNLLDKDSENYLQPLAIPYHIGCGRGNGNWDIIYGILFKNFYLNNIPIVFYEYEEK
jgi:hypothetical protein